MWIFRCGSNKEGRGERRGVGVYDLFVGLLRGVLKRFFGEGGM